MSASTPAVPEPANRRAALRAGAVAATAAAALAAGAGPAAAAAGQPVLQGRSNAAGSGGTSLSSTGSGTTWSVRNTGSGPAASANSARGTGFGATTSGSNSKAVWATNAGAAGTGSAVTASGNNNVGVVASTRAGDITAVQAVNSGEPGWGSALEAYGGENAAVVAVTDALDVAAMSVWGSAYVIGDSIVEGGSTIVLVGDLGVEPEVTYGVVSPSEPHVQRCGTATLDAGGSQQVVVFTAAMQEHLALAGASVVVTPNSGPMPDLWGTLDPSGELAIAGGTASGEVSYVVTVPRAAPQAARTADPASTTLALAARTRETLERTRD